MNRTVDVAIIGGGPGGLSAGIYAKRAMLDTLLIEKSVVGGQVAISPEVENYLGYHTITGGELAAHFVNHAHTTGLEILTEEVTKLDVGNPVHRLTLSGGDVIEARSVILSMGGRPKPLGVPGEEENYGRGVSYCAVCDGFFFRNKTVVVVGGGNTAAEDAIYLAGLAEKVYLVHRRDELRAEKILVAQLQAHEKIEILWSTIITEVVSDDMGVTGVRIQKVGSDQTEILPTDGLFVFAGFMPNNEILPKEIVLDENGYVDADEECATSVPGIYAVGDIIRPNHRQVIVAAGDGAIAAMNVNTYLTNLPKP